MFWRKKREEAVPPRKYITIARFHSHMHGAAMTPVHTDSEIKEIRKRW